MARSPRPVARPFLAPLDGDADPATAARWLRDEPGAVALRGDWLGGVLLLTSHPLVRAGPDDDPFALLDHAPVTLEAVAATDGGDDGPLVGGGWLGWWGFELVRRLEPTVSPAPPDPCSTSPFAVAFHDHVVRCDRSGRWWFEALWTDARDAVLSERLVCWRRRIAGPAPAARPFSVDSLDLAPPGASGHRAAVAEAVARIHEGELSQSNVCLRLGGRLSGDLLDLWVHADRTLAPAYSAYVGGASHAVASLSPELFLQRTGRRVTTRPIKGTAPIHEDPSRLAASAKDRAENVMITDLMRNDLGRVSEYGSVTVEELCAVEPAAGVWHLVSTVTARLAPQVSDGRLLRATFPPGSVSGAPKVRAVRVIHELEATARRAYCGAIGMCSPIAGLELNVAIRTFEAARGRLWLGAGGGIVADSDPSAEVAEAMVKAAGVARAIGLEPPAPAPPRRPAGMPRPLRRPRPDPDAGVIETVLVGGGRARHLADHLARLTASCRSLGLALDVEAVRRAVDGAAGGGLPAGTDGAVRVQVSRGGVELTTRPLPAPGPTALDPVTLPGGLGAHKWADRSLVDGLSAPAATPLFCDLDGAVLEAGYAAVVIVAAGDLVAPPLDGRILGSLSRERLLAAARSRGVPVTVRPFDLDEVRSADAVLLCSTLRGPHPGLLAGGPGAAAAEAARDRLTGTDGGVSGTGAAAGGGS